MASTTSTTKPLSRRRKAAFAVVTFGLLVVLPLATIELGARAYLRVKHGRPGKAYGLYVADDELGATLGPNRYNHLTATNDVGMRGNEDLQEPRPPGSLRIVCYGGSTTFGYNLEDGQTWPEQLQLALRALPGHERDQVLNGGHVAWSLGHLVRQARRDLPALRPDIVILYTGVNEELNAAYLGASGQRPEALLASGQWGVVARDFPFCRWYHRHFVLGRLYDKLLTPARQDGDAPEEGGAAGDSPEWRAGWTHRNYIRMLDEMIDLVRANGGTPLFVVEAGVLDRTRYMRRYSAAGAEEARRLGVATCDPRPALEQGSDARALFSETGLHPNSRGAIVLADEVRDCILALPASPASVAP